MDTTQPRYITDEEYFNIVRNKTRIHVNFNQLLRDLFAIDEHEDENTDKNGNIKRDINPEKCD